MKDFTVLVDFKGEAVSLGADNVSDALERVRVIISEQYGQSVANDATYKIEKEEENK